MLIEWLEPLQIPIIRNSLIGLMLAGGMFSLLGVVVISLNLTGLRFTLMHVGLLGAAVGISLGISPTTGAFILIIIISGLLGTIGDRLQLSVNSLSGLFMTGSLAVAFLILARSGVPAMEVFGIFAGSILFLTTVDLVVIASLGLLILSVFFFGFREIQLTLVDKDLAKSLGVPVGLIHLIIFLLLGSAVAFALKLVGALLVDSVLLLPAMAALPLTSGLKSALFLTSLFGMLSSTSGFLLALRFDLPVGASVAVSGTGILLLSLLVQRRNRK